MQSGDSEIGVVRTGRKRVPLPANQVTTVYIRAHVSSQAQGQHMVFSPGMLNSPPEGLIYHDPRKESAIHTHLCGQHY